MVQIAGTTIEGEDSSKSLALRLGPPAEPRKRLSDAGLMLVPPISMGVRVATSP